MEYIGVLAGFFIVTIFLRWKFKIHNTSEKRKAELLLWLLTIAIIGILWDYFATWRGHWTFPGNGLISIRIFGLPIEEYLFCLITPFFAITVYKIYKKNIDL